MSATLHCAQALLPEGWQADVRVSIASDGSIGAVQPGVVSQPDDEIIGPTIPGIPNAHSHAFQRAMAGLAEYRGSQVSQETDSFWSWRETMYDFAARVTPELLQAIAAQLYVEMLKAGYTAVAEFHYLHHAPDGRACSPLAAMAEALVTAAAQTGIGLTLLPVLYERGGFGGQPLNGRQRRFASSAARFAQLQADCAELTAGQPNQRTGLALHSLRAVSPERLAAAVEIAPGPIHIHVAEQPAEVRDCQAATGLRPVDWLLQYQPPDERWTLVHATHMTDAESRDLAACGATVALCPTTEANLGDGLFDLPRFLDAGGRIAIGSDSQISVDPREELRWLEYGQRLTGLSRNVIADDKQPHTGLNLLQRCLSGGAQALGQPLGRIAAGARADLVVLDERSPALVHTPTEALADSWIFCGLPTPPRHVLVGGKWCIRDGTHHDQDAIAAKFRRSVKDLRLAR